MDVYDLIEKDLSGRSVREIEMLTEELKNLSKDEVNKFSIFLMDKYFDLRKKYAPQKKEVRMAKIKWNLVCAEWRRRNAIELRLIGR